MAWRALPSPHLFAASSRIRCLRCQSQSAPVPLNMKLFTALPWVGTITQVYSASPEANVYLSDHSGRHDTKPPSIYPSEARLLFAQRLGLSIYHSLGDASDSTLEFLNTFGSQQKQVFPEDYWQEEPSRLLVIVEGIEHPEGTYDFISSNLWQACCIKHRR